MNNNRATTYDFRKLAANAATNLEHDEHVLPANRREIQSFQRHIATEGLGFARQVKYIQTLRQVFAGSHKPATKWTKEDVEAFVNRIESADYSAWTKHDYRVVLKRFFRWLRGTEDYPPEVRALKIGARCTSRKLPEEMLTEEEVGMMVPACPSPRDAAFIASLYETGCRPDELGSLRIKHVHPDQYGFVLLVNGKTGMRRARVCLFAHVLAAWLELHPRRGDPEAVLWASRTDSNCRVPPSNSILNRMVKLAARRVGINKRIYPYIFRHSRATFLASRLTEAQMNAVFGWTQGSDMPRTYVHLSGRDVDGALLQIAGVASSDAQPRESILKPWTCIRCAVSNPGTSRFCGRCAAPHDSAGVFRQEDDVAAAGEWVAEFLKHPVLGPLVKELMKKKQAAEVSPGAPPPAEACP